MTWQLADAVVQEAVPGELTIFHWTRVLSSEITQFMFYSPLRNTLLTGLIGSLLAIFIGVILAWLMARTDLRQGFQPHCAPIYDALLVLSLSLDGAVQNERIGGSLGFQYVTGSVPRLDHYGALPS